MKIILWKKLSPPCLISPSTKKAGLLRLGRKTELGVAGGLVLIDTLMIGRWEKLKACYASSFL